MGDFLEISAGLGILLTSRQAQGVAAEHIETGPRRVQNVLG